ncbi:2-oxoglutarate-dependent dioxygenase 21, chloroplastic-like [Hevea brasiliensis]|nr:2-oxoglutarate-dependent dioxygenase 21, chloroplastic-like [Hevea brasiliensis]
MRALSSQVCGAIMESLSLSSTFWQNKIEQGMQMMGINCYESACQLNNIWTGIAPHTDHTIFTLLVQSSPGLQVMNPSDGCWNAAPGPKGSLHVLVGDHLQVLSNGKYKSVIHRAVPGSEERRLSVASFHSFAMDEVVEPAMELVDKEHPNYKGSSVRDYLNYLSSKESKPFLETLKIVS